MIGNITNSTGSGIQPSIINAGTASSFTFNTSTGALTLNQTVNVPGRSYGRNANDYFGSSVVIADSLGFLAIGAYGHSYTDIGNSRANAGTIFAYNSPTNNTTEWHHEVKVFSSQNAANYTGYKLKSKGNLVVSNYSDYGAGYQGSQVGNGTIEIFKRNSTASWQSSLYINETNSFWIGSGNIADSHYYRGGYDGNNTNALALTNDTLVIGRPQSDGATSGISMPFSGDVITYKQIANSWSNTGNTLTSFGITNDRFAGDTFGYALASNAHTLVVGAPWHGYDVIGTNFVSNAGAVWVYTKTPTGYELMAKIVAPSSNNMSPSNYFNGTTTITQPQNSIVISTSNYTVEAWIYITSYTAGTIYQCQHVTTYTGFIFGLNSTGNIILTHYGKNTRLSSLTMPLNTWTHVAAVRDSNGTRLYQNGVLGLSETFDTGNNYTDGYCDIGNGLNGGFVGYMMEFRISSIARYTAAFTPINNYTSDSNTFILLYPPFNTSYRNTNTRFGYSVAIDVQNSYIVVGAPYINTAFVYQLGSNNAVNYITTLTPDASNSDDMYGNSVAINANRIIIGSPYNDTDSNNTDTVSNAGSVYIYDIDPTTNAVTIDRKEVAFTLDATASDIGANPRSPNDVFGYAVAINEAKTMLIGGPTCSYDSSGNNYLLNAGAVWMRYADTPAPSPIPVTTMVRTVTNAFNGYSIGLINNDGTNWAASGLRSAIVTLGSTEFCLPSANDAPYFNWSLGGIEQDATRLSGLTLPYTTTQMAITDLTPTNISGLTVAKPKSTFMMNIITSDITQQMAELAALVATGFTIGKIVIGSNEYYDTTNFSSRLSPADYLTLLQTWVPIIRAAYPTAKIAAIARFDYQNAITLDQTRSVTWNTILQNPTNALATLVDAVAFEYYCTVTPTPGMSPTLAYAETIVKNQWNDAKLMVTSSLLSAFNTSEWWMVNHNILESSVNVRVSGTWLHGLITLGRVLIFMSQAKITTAYCSDLMGNVFDQAMISPITGQHYKYTSTSRSLISGTAYNILGLGQIMKILGSVMSTGSIANAGPINTGDVNVLAWEFQFGSGGSLVKKIIVINAKTGNYEFVTTGTAETWSMASPWTVLTDTSPIVHQSGVTLKSRGIILNGWSVAVINRS